MRKLVLAVFGSAILIGLLALPAAAVDQGVAVISDGSAEIGDDITECTKDVQGTPIGRGIGFPLVVPKAADLDNKYRLVKLGMPAMVLDQGNGLPSIALGELSICGNVGAVGGQNGIPKLGPWCGMSKGYNGTGKLKFTDLVSPPGKELKVHWSQLSDVGWKFALDTVLPILGKVRAQTTNVDASKGPKKDKWGTLVAVVSARSIPGFTFGPSCANAHNSPGQTFNMDGVAAILNSGGEKGDVITWNDDLDGDADRNDSPIFCKGEYDADNDGAKENTCPIYQAKPKPTKPKDSEPSGEPSPTPDPTPTPDPNQPPEVPTLVSPVNGHNFAAGAAQPFTVQAEDPEGNLYRGEVEVRDAVNTVVATFATQYAQSGANSTGSPSPPLSPGSYTWRARACDLLGSGLCSDWSSSWSVGVASPPGRVSETCTDPAVVDGWFGSAYVRVRPDADPSPRTVWLCLRADQAGGLQHGGRLQLTSSDPLETVDISTAAECNPSGGAVLVRPLLNGEVGNPGQPDHATYRADLWRDGDTMIACVKLTRAGSTVLDHAVLFDPAGGGEPDVDFVEDPPGSYPGVEDPPSNPALGSSDCLVQAGLRTRVLNADVAGTHVWMYSHTAGDTTKLCVRVEGASAAGGRMTITSGSGVAVPVSVDHEAAAPDDPSSPCTLNIWSNTDPVSVKTRRSSETADPLALCAGISGVNVWLLADRTPGGTPPNAVWTAD